MTSEKERAALLHDLAGYRVLAAALKREVAQMDRAGAQHAAQSLACEIVGDALADYHHGMSRRLYAAMNAAYEQRAVALEQIRELERELTR